MKSLLITSLLLLSTQFVLVAEIDKDGFEIVNLVSASKSFTFQDAKVTNFHNSVKGKFRQSEGGTMVWGDVKSEKYKYEDGKGNFVWIKHSENLKTNEKSSKIVIHGTKEFFHKQKKLLKG